MPWYVEEHFRVVLGGNTFIDTPTLLEYKGESLFTIERQEDTGHLAISFKINDEHGRHRASVVRNVLHLNEHYVGQNPFVINGKVHDWVIGEEGTGKLVCAIRQKEAAKPAELQVSVNLYTSDGQLVSATPDDINLRGIIMRRCTFERCRAGIVIGPDGAAALGRS